MQQTDGFVQFQKTKVARLHLSVPKIETKVLQHLKSGHKISRERKSYTGT
jgi:hypothetical protein